MKNLKWFGATALVAFAGLSMQVYGEMDEGQLVTVAGTPGIGYEDGLYPDARFGEPEGIAIKEGALAVADTANNLIRMAGGRRVVTQAGNIQGRDAAGYVWGGYKDSSKAYSYFNAPADCDFYDGWKLAVADRKNNAVRVIGDSWVYTIGGQGEEGYKESDIGYEALFSGPSGIAVNRWKKAYVADTGNHAIRAIAPSGETRTIAGTGEAGFSEGQPKEAQLYSPSDVAWEDGILYICDTGNSALRTMEFEPQKWLESLEQE